MGWKLLGPVPGPRASHGYRLLREGKRCSRARLGSDAPPEERLILSRSWRRREFLGLERGLVSSGRACGVDEVWGRVEAARWTRVCGRGFSGGVGG
ncbi:MAG: hypothetical protein R6X31_08425 [Anaerolineae bacterium]